MLGGRLQNEIITLNVPPRPHHSQAFGVILLQEKEPAPLFTGRGGAGDKACLLVGRALQGNLEGNFWGAAWAKTCTY